MSRTRRTVDVVVSSIALLFLSPILLAIAAVVRATSEGPVFFWSRRIGTRNGEFWMPKFRTMTIDAPLVASHLLQVPSSVVTPVGKWLRRYSLDELPQFWSILIGDLTLIGPRPALFNQADLIALRTQSGVCRMVPGLTGWAQVNGRDDLSIEAKADLDLQYMQARSLTLDLRILLMTILRVVSSHGVSH